MQPLRPTLAALLILLVAGCGFRVDDDDDSLRDDDDATDPVDDDDSATADDDDATPPDDDDTTPTSDGIDDFVVFLLDPATSSSEIESVLHDLAWEGAVPLRIEDRWLFVTEWGDAPGDVSLVGDLNDWTPGAHPATTSAAGDHRFVVVAEDDFAVPAAGSRYRWYSDPDTWRDPPESTAYGYDAFGLIGYVQAPTDVAWRERFPAHVGAHLAAPRAFRALLPAGFQPLSVSAGTFRTLLMHDGQNVFDEDAIGGGWRVHEALADGGWDDVVVLAVDNASDRLDAYAHAVDQPPFGEGDDYGGLAPQYLALLDEEALPFFRARYGVAAIGDSLTVAGSSMGGLVSLYMAMTVPDDQACVIAMSSSVDWGSFGPTNPGTEALANLWPASYGHGATSIYLDSGGAEGTGCVDVDGDGIVEESEDSDNYCVTVQLRDVLAGLGYTFEVDLWHWHEPFAAHNEAAWAARMPQALEACTAGGWATP